MEPLKYAAHRKLISTLTKHKLYDLEIELLTLPAGYGGMSFDDAVANSPNVPLPSQVYFGW